jgi:SAM-dependent methyltransferase
MLKKKHRLTRYKMYQDIEKNLRKPMSGKILAISSPEGFSEMIDLKNSEITETSFPEVDCQNLPFEDNSFDYVISDQVLEHITMPEQAIKEALRVLKPNGIAIHTTCFMNYYHPSPIDYFRFSPDALKYLHHGYSRIIIGGWGNRLAIAICMLGDRFRAIPIPNHKYSLRNFIASYNKTRYPISTWSIAEK